MADILLVLIMALFCLWGVKKGLISTLFSLISVFLAIFLVYLLKDVFIQAVVDSSLGDYIGNLVAKNAPPLIAEKCTEAIVTVISLILLYFIVRIVLGFVVKLLNIVAKLPVINTINSLTGGILGFAVGVVWATILTSVLFEIPRCVSFISDSTIAEFLCIFI